MHSPVKIRENYFLPESRYLRHVIDNLDIRGNKKRKHLSPNTKTYRHWQTFNAIHQ